MNHLKYEHTVFRCGPLQVTISTHLEVLRKKAWDTLVLFNVTWPEVRSRVQVTIFSEWRNSSVVSGNYLQTARMLVDQLPSGLEAACDSGSMAIYDEVEKSWQLFIPEPDGRELLDLVNLLDLIITTGWRELGWVPMHAGGAIYGDNCAILCAPSGGGKSTLTTALLSRGWGTLGDDKLLLTVDSGGVPSISSLLLNFNLHPYTEQWFPEVGDLQRFPAYSEWTPKRRVDVTTIWPQTSRLQARPTDLVLLRRRSEYTGFGLKPIDEKDLLPLLLQQTVIPRHSEQGRHIFNTIAKTTSQMRGWTLEIGEHAYDHADQLKILEEALAKR